MKTILDFQVPKEYPTFTTVDEVYAALETAVKQCVRKIKFVNAIPCFNDFFALHQCICEKTGLRIEVINGITEISVPKQIWAGIDKDGNIIYFITTHWPGMEKYVISHSHECRIREHIWVNHGHASQIPVEKLQKVVDFKLIEL